jgi:hypothetical protein
VLPHRVGKGHVTPERVLHSNLGCCIGTINKSAAYKTSGAVERRAVAIRELVENKRRQLKEKTGTHDGSRHPYQSLHFCFVELPNNASRSFKTKYCLRGGSS